MLHLNLRKILKCMGENCIWQLIAFFGRLGKNKNYVFNGTDQSCGPRSDTAPFATQGSSEMKCVSNWNDCLESTRAAHAADCSELLDTIWARSGQVGSHTYSRMHAAPSIRRRNASP